MPKLPAIVPQPQRALARTGSFRLSPRVPIALRPGASDADVASAFALRDGIERRCGAALPVEVHGRSADLGPRIELRCDGASGEAHSLRVETQRAALRGDGPAGLRYAVETLLQLVSPRGRIPCCEVDDRPDFALRGVMLDVSRGKVPTPDTLRALVDACVALKLNALMLYTEHTFRFRRHPKIGADASPLDAQTLLTLDAYAAARHVELIPTLQSLGHMEHVLEHPEYAPLAESDARWTISPAAPGTYELLADLYDEYLPLFRSKWFNANCDEPFDLERGASAQRARELGPGGVFLEHVRKVRDLAAAHGKRTMIWGDVVHAHPERIPEIDRDLVMLDWWYEADFDFDRVARFADNAIEFVVCPGTSSWNGLFPRIANSERNIARYSDAGKRHGALGLIVTDWGDGGHYNLLGGSWFGYAWAAQHAWSGAADRAAFDRAFGNARFGDRSGAAARCYRALGAVHDAGFPVFNGSALQLLFFDDLDRGYFAEGVKPATLRASGRKLRRASELLDASRDAFGADELTWRELRLAADCSRLAIRKGLAGRDYVRWRRGGALDARARGRLARELGGLATEQRALLRRLRALWLARSAPSNFEITARRAKRSADGMRRAARALERNRPAAPPPAHPGFGIGEVIRALRESLRP